MQLQQLVEAPHVPLAHLGPFQQDEWLKQPGILSIFDAWHLSSESSVKTSVHLQAKSRDLSGAITCKLVFRYAAMPKKTIEDSKSVKGVKG